MNGLGLPVCWCGCDGPNPDFTTDGQCMVTTGGVGDSSGFVEQQMDEIAEADRGNCDVARMVDEIDGTDAHDESEGATDDMAMNIVARLIALDGGRFDEFVACVRSEDYRKAALVLGIPFSAFRNQTSPGMVLAKAVRNMTGEQWRIVRQIINGDSQSKVGQKFGDGIRLGIRKQAVNKRLSKIMEDNPWVRTACGLDTRTAHPHAREVSQHFIK